MAARNAARNLMNQVVHHSFCPCHSCQRVNSASDLLSARQALRSKGAARHYATPIAEKEYAFEVSASNLRFGEGVTREVGIDFKNMDAQKVGVYTDSTIKHLLPMQMATSSLNENGVSYEVYSNCRVEPTQESWQEAIDWAKARNITHFLAVGGGSVIDTCKVANLYTTFPDADFLDFVNAPIGKGLPINKQLKPLIAVPTTAGTGSETTGTAIFDYTPLSAKTGIANRALRPLLGIVDPLNTDSCPQAVHVSAGLDVLFHSLESYTAIPYHERSPRPTNPLQRPAYQGANPISDVFSRWALGECITHLPRVGKDPSDKESKTQMLLASSFAGIGFGNAGVHVCHGLSYPVSGLNKRTAKYKHAGYEVDHPIVPHGISVALSGPAVFEFTAPSHPDRHREVAALFGAHDPDGVQDDRVSNEDIGKLLRDRIARFLVNLGIPRGLGAIGYKNEHIADLVKGTLPQRRVLDLAPGLKDAEDKGVAALTKIVENSMSF